MNGDCTCKIRPVIDPLNKAFQHALGRDLHQSIDERMETFKQYINKQTNKVGIQTLDTG